MVVSLSIVFISVLLTFVTVVAFPLLPSTGHLRRVNLMKIMFIVRCLLWRNGNQLHAFIFSVVQIYPTLLSTAGNFDLLEKISYGMLPVHLG